MFQRLSFSPLSPPQIRGSPRTFATKLFSRGKSSSFTLPSPGERPTSSPALGLDGSPGSYRRKLDSVCQEAADEDGGDTQEDVSDPGGNHRASPDLEDTAGAADSSDELLYEAESPDEAALVHAAKAYGCVLRARSADSLLVDLPGIGCLRVRLLHILPFDSNRKRMSVVVRHPLSGQVVVYTKGADSVIMDLTETPKGDVQAPGMHAFRNNFLW